MIEITEALKENIYPKLLRFVMSQPRSEVELRRKLKSSLNLYSKKYGVIDDTDQISEAFIHKIISDKWFVEKDNLDQIVKSMLNSSKARSWQTIEKLLIKKGFNRGLISLSKQAIPNLTLLDKSSALVLAKKKYSQMSSTSGEKQARLKLTKYLMGKGYSYDISKGAVDMVFDVK